MKRLSLAYALPLLLTGCSMFGLFGGGDTVQAVKEGKPDPLVAQAEQQAKEQAAQVVADNPLQGPAPVGPIDAPPTVKKRMMVLPFVNRTEYGGVVLGKNIGLDIKDELSRADDFAMVGESDYDEIDVLDKDNGSYNYKFIFEQARARGVSAVVSGTLESLRIQERGEEVGLFQTRYQTVQAQVRFDLHDASTEKLLYSKTANAEVTEEHTRFFNQRDPQGEDFDRGRSAVTKAFEKVSEPFLMQARKISWMGRIAKIDLNRYYVNAGEASGILKGQLLKVFGEGLPIVDDESGATLGIAPGRFKGILRVVDYFGNDGTVAVMHSGAGFRERDKVEIYSPPQQ